MILGPSAVFGAPEVAHGIGLRGGGDGVPDGDGEGLAAGKSPVVGDMLVAHLQKQSSNQQGQTTNINTEWGGSAFARFC